MAASKGLALGFSEVKLERRRPSKRETTRRPFSIVRNWESKQAQPAVKTPIKEDAPKKELLDSPVFPPPSSARQSLEVPLTSLTSNSDDTGNSLTETTSDASFQPGEQNQEVCNSIDNPSTSIVVDEVTPPQPMSVPPTPESHIQVALQVPMAISPPKPVPNHQDTRAPVIKPASISIDSQSSSRVTRGRKRKHPDKVMSEEMMRKKVDADDDVVDDDDDDAQYSGNNFVRIFNADQGRKVTMEEITALDVALTAIEELALEYREEVDKDVVRQSIKEFFILVRKSFCECIDIQKDFQTLKSDFRKANSRIKKLRGELLDVQRKKSKIQGELEKYKNEEMENEKNNQDMLDISEYLHQVEYLHKSCKMASKESEYQNKDLPSNLPSLLSQTHAKLNSVSKLKSINSSLQKLLCI